MGLALRYRFVFVRSIIHGLMRIYYRMHKPMVSWHLSRRIPKQKCIFYMPHTVHILSQIANTGESLTSLGVGALVSPLVATQFAQLPHWSFHFLTSLVVAIINVVFLTSVFKLKTQDGGSISFTSFHNLPALRIAILIKNGQAPAETSTSHQSIMRQILGNKSVHLVAFFVLAYVGIEVTIGGGFLEILNWYISLQLVLCRVDRDIHHR